MTKSVNSSHPDIFYIWGQQIVYKKVKYTMSLILCILAMIFALFACANEVEIAATPTEDNASANVPSVQPILDIQLNESQDGTLTAETDLARYIIHGRSEEEGRKLVQGAEAILTVSGDEYNFRSQSLVGVTILFQQPGEPANIRIGHINIDPEDALSLGAIISHEASGRLPAWLCAGLELAILERNGLGRFDFDANYEGGASTIPVGDEWFIPGFFAEGIPGYALSALHGFVRHLEETGQLDRLIELYRLPGTAAEAEALRSSAWQGFTGQSLDNSTIFRHYYNSRLTALSAQGNYTFEPATWHWAQVQSYNEIMDDGIILPRAGWGMNTNSQ
jgi:hypothetical protein